jgi:hypothetical protein
MLLAALLLNGLCAYFLAYRITRDSAAAVIGGLVFAASPYIAAHLNGHYNLTSAWTIALFAVAAAEALDTHEAIWAIAAGLVMGATAYVDYYYVLDEMALALCLAAISPRPAPLIFRGPDPRTRRLRQFLLLLLLLDLAAIVAIWITGGVDFTLASVGVSAHELFNPLQLFWILAGLLLAISLRPRLDRRSSGESAAMRGCRTLALLMAVFLVIASPIVWSGVTLIANGQYVAPALLWRSTSKGVDLGTLLLGNPFHPIWGPAVQQAYHGFGIDVIESAGWLGITPVVLAVSAVIRSRARHHSETLLPANRWAIIGVIFFVWSLGPHLTVFGTNTGMPLPHALIRYLPIAANARMPGRAIVVTFLSVAMLCAMATAEWRSRSRRAAWLPVVVALAIGVDYLPAPFPLAELERPPIYEVLKSRPEGGSVCELPLGVRDGFGEHGVFDDRVLYYQTIHQRPLTGGFVARLPRAVEAAYSNDPLLSALLRLSARNRPWNDVEATLPDRLLAADRLRENGIAFVVLNRRTASRELVDYVQRTLPLTRIADDDERSLYVVSR